MPELKTDYSQALFEEPFHAQAAKPSACAGTKKRAIITEVNLNSTHSYHPWKDKTLAGFILTVAVLFFVGSGAIEPATSFAGTTVAVSPGDDIQALVNQNPTGTTFSFAAGTYRMVSIVPKSNDVFTGPSTAVLSGATVLTSFSQSGSVWASKVQVTQLSSYPGLCDSTHPICMYPEDIFFDNNLKLRVASLSAVVPGTWYLDYSSGNAYLGDNPSGHTVEISLTPHAFSGTAAGVLIYGLTIEKYANLAQTGAVHAANGKGWNVKMCEVRYNHGTGIRTTDSMYVWKCYAHHNGQLGIGGGGANLCIQSCELSYNNTSGYNFSWEAGGLKLGKASNTTIQYCNSHNNNGPGLMTDCASKYITYDSNTLSYNQEAGIYHEISYDAVIKNNTITGDGFNPKGTGPWYGAGINVYDSANVQVYGNKLINCANAIIGRQDDRGNGPDGQPYSLKNLSVHDNTITQSSGYAEGIVASTAYNGVIYASWNNHFQNDTYNLANSATYKYFFWLAQSWTLGTWNTYVSEH